MTGRFAHQRRRGKRRAGIVVVLALMAIVAAVGPGPLRGFDRSGFAAGAAFDPNVLMSDAVFDATGTMSTAQIQALLNRYPNSCLRTYSAPVPVDYSTYGANVSAAEVIHSAALLYGVNPQVLLATLEKEQSMVTGSGGCQPWRYWSAMGYACPDGGARYNYPTLGITGTCVSSQQHAGFSPQVNHAAWQLQFNRQRAIGNLNWRGNQSVHNYGFYTKGYRQQFAGAPSVYYDGTATIDGQSITMTNGPTATLYTYTPHISANQAFVTLFTNWFGSPLGTPSTVPTTTVAPYSASQYATYVDNVYRLVAGRPSTADEQQAWTTYFLGGGPIANFVRLMTVMPSYGQNLIAEDYVRLLGRTPDPSGAQSWFDLLQRGGRNDAVLAGLAGSDEYFRRCSSDTGLFVKCLYLNLLSRQVDPGGYETWTQQLTTGHMSRREVAGRIMTSSEYATNFVDQAYRQILGRPADSSGSATWVKVYDQARSEAAVDRGLIGSTEGFNRLSAAS